MDNNRTFSLKAFIKDNSEIDSLISESKVSSGDVVFNTTEGKMYEIKEDNTFAEFDPVEVVARTSNNMIVMFETYEEFVEKLSFIPENSKVYIRNINSIYKKNEQHLFEREGTPEELGIKIYK